MLSWFIMLVKIRTVKILLNYDCIFKRRTWFLKQIKWWFWNIGVSKKVWNCRLRTLLINFLVLKLYRCHNIQIFNFLFLFTPLILLLWLLLEIVTLLFKHFVIVFRTLIILILFYLNLIFGYDLIWYFKFLIYNRSQILRFLIGIDLLKSRLICTLIINHNMISLRIKILKMTLYCSRHFD